MKRFVISLFLVAGTMLGCAQNHFNIPAENFAEKVKVLGVAPIMIDADSEITYPQIEILLPLINDLNRKFEPLLIRKLQGTGNFFAVSPQTDDPKRLFTSLVARREKRDDAGIQYNKYFWKNDKIDAYIQKNRVDAVMLIVVSGQIKSSKIFSGNLLKSLDTDYNFLTMTAQIVGPEGTVLWEYPNFRGRLLPYYPLVNLQYPDFSESDANLSAKTEVRFKSIDGIRRTLEQKKSDWVLRETQEPEVYGRIFDEMVSLIAYSVEKKGAEVAPTAKLPTADKPVKIRPVPVPIAVPPQVIETPVQAPAPVGASSPPAARDSAPVTIVPATESTR